MKLLTAKKPSKVQGKLRISYRFWTSYLPAIKTTATLCLLLAGSVLVSLTLWENWFSGLKHSSFVKFLGRLINGKSCFTSSKIPVLFPPHFQRVNCHNIFSYSRWMAVKTIINRNGKLEIWKYHQLCVRLQKRHSNDFLSIWMPLSKPNTWLMLLLQRY